MTPPDDRFPRGKPPAAASAAERIEAIIEGAERAAEKVIDDAEAQAREYLAAAESEADRTVAERLAAVGELAEALLAQADAIRRQAELLAQSLEAARGQLAGAGAADIEVERDGQVAGEEDAEGPGGAVRVAAVGDRRATDSPGSPWRSRGSHLAPVEAEPPPEPAAGSSDGNGRGTPAGARLLATQMAVSGSSREEIEARLRSGFEIEDPEAILDAILGPESQES